MLNIQQGQGKLNTICSILYAIIYCKYLYALGGKKSQNGATVVSEWFSAGEMIKENEAATYYPFLPKTLDFVGMLISHHTLVHFMERSTKLTGELSVN
jgi:hypothetical protein